MRAVKEMMKAEDKQFSNFLSERAELKVQEMRVVTAGCRVSPASVRVTRITISFSAPRL